MRQRLALLLVLLASACATTPAPSAPPSNSTQFAYCAPAKFANCTVAKCEQKKDGNYTCWCFEDDRYSATALATPPSASCAPATQTTLQSRYHPITAYQECGANAPVEQWAWCLGVTCTRSTNPQDPNSNANVRCDCLAIPKNVPPVPYIVTTSSYASDNCKVRYWSSATPSDVSQINTFLQTQVPNLPSPAVLRPPSPAVLRPPASASSAGADPRK